MFNMIVDIAAWVVSAALLLSGIWAVFTKKTLPELLQERGFWPSKGRPEARASPPLAAHGRLMVAVGLALMLIQTIRSLVPQPPDGPTETSAPQLEVGGVLDLPQDFLRFLDLSVVPAGESPSEFARGTIELEQDMLAARAFDLPVRRLENALSVMQRGLAGPAFTEESMLARFCEYYRAYFDAFRWEHWIGRRNDFDFSSRLYATWKTYNERFLEGLRDLMADERYARIRTACATEVTCGN